MRCKCYKCERNDDGYCCDSSYVVIDENGECDLMFIKSNEEPIDKDHLLKGK